MGAPLSEVGAASVHAEALRVVHLCEVADGSDVRSREFALGRRYRALVCARWVSDSSCVAWHVTSVSAVGSLQREP